MNITRQILKSPESIFYHAIQNFQPQWVMGAVTVLNTALAHRQRTFSPLARNLYLTQLFLNFTNTVAVAGELRKLGQLKGRAALSGLLISALTTVLYCTQKWYQGEPTSAEFQKSIPEGYKGRISMTVNRSYPWIYTELTDLARIVINSCIIYFSPQHRLLCGLNIAGLTYDLLKTRQFKWLTFRWTLPFPPPSQEENFTPDSTRPEAIFFESRHPLAPSSDKKEPCTICLDELGKSSSISFCPPHALVHEHCLGKYLVSSVKETFLESGRFPEYSFTPVYDSNKRIIRYLAKIEIEQSHLPNCPECRTYPDNHFIKAQYVDRNKSKGPFETTLNIIPDPTALTPSRPLISATLGARLSTLSSALQAGLAAMQHRHPELSGKILLGQKVFSVVDLGIVIQNYIEFYKLLYKRYVLAKVEQNIPDNVGKAQAELEMAKLSEYRLSGDIEEEKQSGNLIRVGKDSIELPVEGETIHIMFDDYIPLSHQSSLLIKELLESIKNRDIDKLDDAHIIPITENGVDLLDRLTIAHSEHRIAFIHYLNGNDFLRLLPLSPTGKEFLEGLNNEFISDELLDQIKEACKQLEIIEIDENVWIPLTDEAKERLKAHNIAFAKLEKAYNDLATAQKEKQNARVELEKRYRLHLLIALGAASVVLPSISILIAGFLNRQLRPKLDLTEILKKVAQPTDFKNMKVSWNLPGLQYSSHCLMVGKIIMSIALAVFSADQKTFALSALLQSFTLGTLSRLLWIKLERTFFSSEVRKTVNASFEILLPSFSSVKENCHSLSSHLEGQLKSICDYTYKVFEGSEWKGYWLIQKRNNIEISRSLHYDVVLQPSASALIASECKAQAILSGFKLACCEKVGAIFHVKWPAATH